MPNYSELLTEYNNLSKEERKQLMGAIGLKARSLLTDYEKLSNIERRELTTEFQRREKIKPISPVSPIKPSPFKAEFAPSEPATTAITPEKPQPTIPPRAEIGALPVISDVEYEALERDLPARVGKALGELDLKDYGEYFKKHPEELGTGVEDVIVRSIIMHSPLGYLPRLLKIMPRYEQVKWELAKKKHPAAHMIGERVGFLSSLALLQGVVGFPVEQAVAKGTAPFFKPFTHGKAMMKMLAGASRGASIWGLRGLLEEASKQRDLEDYSVKRLLKETGWETIFGSVWGTALAIPKAVARVSAAGVGTGLFTTAKTLTEKHKLTKVDLLNIGLTSAFSAVLASVGAKRAEAEWGKLNDWTFGYQRGTNPHMDKLMTEMLKTPKHVPTTLMRKITAGITNVKWTKTMRKMYPKGLKFDWFDAQGNAYIVGKVSKPFRWKTATGEIKTEMIPEIYKFRPSGELSQYIQKVKPIAVVETIKNMPKGFGEVTPEMQTQWVRNFAKSMWYQDDATNAVQFANNQFQELLPLTPKIPVEKEAEPTTYAEEIAKMEREFPYMTEEARIDAERRARLAAEKPLPPVEKKVVEPTLTTKEKDLFEKIKTRLGEETKIESINKLSERIVKRIGVPLGKRRKAKMDLTRRAILDVKRDIRKKAQKIAKLNLKGLDPEDRAEIEAIRNNIDPSFRTKKTLMRRKGTLEYVKRMKEEEQEITVPADVLKMLYKIPLNQMTPAEFEQSYNAVMTIYQQAKLKNKLLKTLGDRDYNKTKQQLIGELKIQQRPVRELPLPQVPKTIKAAKERRSFKKLWQRYLLEARIPVDFFELLDGHKVGTFSKVFWDSSEDALSNELKLVDKRKKEIKDFVEKLGVNQDDLMFKFETINKKWKLPPAMKMGVYIYSQNPTARLSLGIVEGFSEQDITDVINKLTVKEKKIADEFIKSASKYYKVENDIFNKLHGFDMPREPNYFPIMRDFSAAELPKYKLEEIKRLFEKTGFRQPYVERGWSIKRIPKPSPTTPPMFLDIFKVMDRHIHSTSHFITHGELIRDLRKLANDKELNAELIKTFRNKKINQELLDYVRNIANYNETDPMSNWAEKISRALRSGIVPAYLGLNIVTSFRQPISWLLGASEVGLNWATAGTLDFVTEPRKVLNFIRETNPQIAPEHRFIERDIREMLGPEAYSKFKRFNRKKKRFFMVLLRATDQPTVCAIYRGGYLKGRHRGMSHNEAVNYARRVIEKTQPMGRRKSVPKLFRGNELLRWFTMFKNQPVRIFNYMLEDIIGKRAARNISTYDALRRILLILVSAQAMGIVSRGRFRRDRREQIIDTISFHIFGAPIIGALIDQQLRGFKSEFIPFRFVNDIGRIFKSKTAPTKWKYVMKTIAILNGIPWNQPYRTGVAISKLMRGKGIDLRELIWSKYQLREPKKPKPEKARKLTPMEIDRLLGK